MTAPLWQGVDSTMAYVLDAATSEIERSYRVERHQIAASLLDESGRLYTGIHIEALIGRASVCAESVALGNAVMAAAAPLVLAVAVRHPKPTEHARGIEVVPPCGICRELLLDYAPEIDVIVPSGITVERRPLRTLLPVKYEGTKWRL